MQLPIEQIRSEIEIDEYHLTQEIPKYALYKKTRLRALLRTNRTTAESGESVKSTAESDFGVKTRQGERTDDEPTQKGQN